MKTISLNTESKWIREDLERILKSDLPWDTLRGKKILLTGAAGMLAAYIAETLLNLPFELELYAVIRNHTKAQQRLSRYLSDPRLHIISMNLSQALPPDFPECNIILHFASIPRPDNMIPVDVAEPNIQGTWNLLQYARRCPDFEQFIFCSSAGIYGQSKTNEHVKESSSVQLDPLAVTSCYLMSKVAGENCCMLFDTQYDIPCKILRYAHTYGPGIDLNHDPRSFAAFLSNVLHKEDIVLFSKGEQTRCFCYIADATEAFFHVLLKGERKNAYNIAAPQNKITILELAHILSQLDKERQVGVVIKGKEKIQGFVPLNTDAIPDISKIQALGFTPTTSIKEGFRRTLFSYTIKSDDETSNQTLYRGKND